jgi:hypothetical protein
MESHLDRLAKAVASGISRRQALHWLGGGLLSLFGLGMARGQAGASCEAKCPPVSSTFSPAQRNSCLRQCVDCQAANNPGTACVNPTTGAVACCRSGERCCGSTCCPNGRICCGNNPVCCNGGEICILSAAGAYSCCKSNNVCGTPPSASGGTGQTCCKDDESCINGRTCCKKDKVCGPPGAQRCCPDGTRCVQTATGFACVCPDDQILVGNTCCKKTNICGPATAPQTCCTDDASCISGACCPKTCRVSTTTSSGNVVVTCCLQGQRCVNGRCVVLGGV